MNSTSKFLYFTSILLGLMFTSCSHPDKDFKKMLEQKSEDKFVDKVELSSLDRQLQKALKKSQRGIIFGVDTIKSHDSMVGYLVDKKGCEVEGEMPAKAVKFDTFHILLENSISMQGYIGRGNPDFAEPIIINQKTKKMTRKRRMKLIQMILLYISQIFGKLMN